MSCGVCLAGGTLAYADQELLLNRTGEPEPVWMNLDYSPVLNEAGEPAGVIAIVVETTAKVVAENWLQGEQERLRRMFEQAPGFMAMLRGPEHVFEMTNPAYVTLLGNRELLGRPVRQAAADVSGQGFFELLDQVYATGVAASAVSAPIELQRSPDAAREVRYLDFVYQPVRDVAGAVVGIFVQGVDVTDRVTAEAAKRESDSRNRQIIDSAIDYGIIATRLDGVVTHWNTGAAHITGWFEAEMVGQDASRFFTPEDRAAGVVQAEMATALREGRASDERWHLRRSGERFWANGEMTVLRNEAGQAVGFVKVLRDRTEQHRADQALAQSEAQLRRAQEAGGIGLFTLDMTTDMIRTTPEFCRTFGVPYREIVAASEIEALAVPEDAELMSSASRRRDGSAAVDVEYRIRRRDTGEVRTIARKGEYERDETGEPVRLVGVVQDVTERRAVQSALEASEAQFRTFAEAAPNQMWTAQPDGRLDWFNARVYAYSGAEPGALDGAEWTAIVHPDDVAIAGERWAASLAGGMTYETEFRLRGADGTYRWHLARALPIRDSADRITRWIGTNTDIHERKLAETENSRDRDRLWTMSQDLLLVCDFDGTITAINPSATRILGWAEEEMVGRPLGDFVHPDDVDRSVTEVGKLVGGAKTLAFENRYRTKAGDYRVLDWTAVPDAGRIHGVGRDITDERALARDQERIWTLSPVLKVVANMVGDVHTVNPAWSQALGWTPEETLGRNIMEFVAPEDADNGMAGMAQLAEGVPVVDYPITFAHRDGSRRRIAWTTVPEQGTLYGFGRDITVEVEAADALSAAEDALRQSQKMEAVGQLTGGIAHDFNNLLQGITGSLDLVKKRISQGRLGELDRFIDGAMTSASRAAGLTHRLLAFSRRQPLDPRPVRANPLVSSMEDLLRRTLGERIELDLALAEDLWLTRCDPNQLESAILNLAINARDAMPGGGRLVIETANTTLDAAYAARQRDVTPGAYVCVSVTDTGVGMDADTAARAFEPFFTTKPIGQGTGLGLSMIYGFARQSEGFARIYSEVGQGTTFKLYLPRHRGEADTDDEPVAAPASQARDGETVLVVEDEVVVRNLIVEVLSDLGYSAVEAADGPSGLEILQSGRRIDLLITDIGLPVLNGRQIADAGRALRPDLKVLFMTGYAENAAVSSGFLEPGMAMITKPFAMEVLATRIRDIIEERS
jgi:PAS domain S-box-containing protein